MSAPSVFPSVRPSRHGAFTRSAVLFAAVVLAALALVVAARGASAQPAPGNFGWQFLDLDGPGVAGGNGRSAEPVQAAGSSTVLYGGIPHVFYRSGDLLRHAWAPVSGLNFETIDGAGGGNGRTTNAVGSGTSAVQFGNDLHVFYADTQTGVLRHSWYSLSANRWFAESLDGPGVPGGFGRTSNQVGGETSTVLFGGTPHIFYTDLTAGDLRQAWWTGTRWQFQTLDGAGGTGGRVNGVIAVGDSAVTVPGSPLALQVFYRNDTTQRLRLAAYNTAAFAWQFRDLDGPGVTGGGGRQNVSTGIAPSAVVVGGRPQVFYGNANTQLRQGFVNSAGLWLFTTLQSPADCGGCEPGVEPAATLYNGLPVVAHHDAAFGRLLLSRWTGSAWVNEALDGNGVTGGAGRTSDEVGLSASIIQYGVQLTIQNVDVTESRLRQAWFGPAPPVNQTPPTISGTPAVGQALAVLSNGTWTNAPTSFTYQWQRCPFTLLPSCSDIAGATSSSYVVTDADINSALTVRVRAANAFGGGTATAAQSAAVPWPAPVATSLNPTSGPDLGGTTVVIAGKYFADVTDVTFAGATVPYTVDSPTQITATTPGGAPGPVDVVVTSATGTSTPLVFTYELTPPVNETPPQITGTAEVGGTLTASDGTWTNSPTAFAFQWQRCPVPLGVGAQNGGGCADIAGAIGSTYVATDDDISYTLQAVVVATNAAGDSDPATSARTQPVPLPDPTITSVSPNEGPVAGGQTVTVTGTYFSPSLSTVTVSVGGTAATNVVVVSATELTFTTPAGTAGAADVEVFTSAGSDIETDGYTYFDEPTITGISPDEGPVAGGQSVTVTGTNLVATGTFQTTVTVGGAAVTNLVVVSDTELSFDTPAGSAGAADVVVTTAGGSVTETGGYTYFDEPTILTVVPDEGPSVGDQSVTVTGTNFADGVTAVTVDGADVTNFAVVSATELTFDTPAGTAGLVDVTVTTPGGTATATDGYEYFDAPTISTIIPIAGPEGGAQTVQVTGANFRPGVGLTTVTLAGNPVGSLDVTSSTQFTFVTPAGTPGAVDLVVTTIGGTATATGGYTYLAAPTVTTLSPSSGPVAGGQTVTITGTALDVPGLAVTVDGNAATSVTSLSATQATFVTPAGTAGAVDVVVTTDGGETTATDGYRYLPAPTIVSVTPTEGTTAGGTPVALSGTNLDVAALTVTIGGTPVTNQSVVFPGSLIIFSTPSGAAGPADVVVTTNGGTATLTGGFTYYDAPTITDIDPAFGPVAGGTDVTLTGSNFSSNTTVTVGGEAVTGFTRVSSTELTFTTPGGAAGPADVVVTAVGGTVTGTFTYLPVPAVTSVTPNEGPLAGNETVTVEGTGFVDGETAVAFGTSPGTGVTFVSATALTVVTPEADEPGPVAVTVTTPGGEGELADAYTYLPAPTIEGIDPAEGPVSGGTTVVLTGTDLDVAGLEVTVDGNPATLVPPVSATEITFTTPTGAAGPADVVVTTDGGTATLTGGFTYLPPAVTVVETAGGAGQFTNSLATAIGPGGGMVTTGVFSGAVTFGDGGSTATLTAVGSNDVFVASYDVDGVLQWARQAGGTGSDEGRGVTVAADGSVVVTGKFTDTATFGSGGEAVSLTSAGSDDVFVASYDVAGVLQWAVSAGGTGLDQGNAVSVGTNGAIAVTGPFSGTATFGAGQPNATTSTSAGSQDVFVATYDNAGVLQWVTRAGGNSSDEGRGVAVGTDGSIAVTGDFSGTASFGAVTLTSPASDQVFVASYTAAGVLQWANQAVGNDGGVGRSVDVATDGTVVVSGDFRGTETFVTGGDAVTLVSTPDDFFGDPSQDIFVTSYTAAGVLEWAVQAGGPGLDNNRGVAVDADGSATITGYFSSGFFTNTATFGSGPSAVTLTGNGNNVYVATYDADGDLESAYKVDGNGGLLGNGVAAADGAVAVTGVFSNPNTTFCNNAGGGFAPCAATLLVPPATSVTKSPVGSGDMFLLRIGDAVPAPPVPVNTAVPTVTGTAEIGQTLTTDTGTWDNGPLAYAYRWQRCDAEGADCTDVAGATSATYPVTADDGGSTLRAGVVAANGGGLSEPAYSAVTAVVPALANVAQADAGGYHTCAVVDDDGVEDGAGVVRCWGQNSFGQLGDASTTDSDVPVTVSGITTAVEVSLGENHSCARLADGTVQCWGFNLYGQLGDDTATNSSVPVTVVVAPSTPLSGVVGVAAGYNHTCAVIGDGTVRCWGYNEYGQLGDASTANSSVAVTVAGITTAEDLSAGFAHSCALLADGTLQCWGSNFLGQLGNSASVGGISAVPVPVQVEPGVPLTNVDDVSAGGDHTCAALGDGTARCWGSNFYGELGNGTTSFEPVPVPAVVTGISGAVAVTAGEYHSCALLTDGTARCWGQNFAGQLGDGTTTGSPVPVTVADIGTGVGVTAGAFHTCAVLGNATMRCWGYNDFGQLGDGTTVSSSVPVVVLPGAAPPPD